MAKIGDNSPDGKRTVINDLYDNVKTSPQQREKPPTVKDRAIVFEKRAAETAKRSPFILIKE